MLSQELRQLETTPRPTCCRQHSRKCWARTSSRPVPWLHLKGLSFDFTHYKGLSEWEIQQIEKIVNEKIRGNIEVITEIQDLDEAVG